MKKIALFFGLVLAVSGGEISWAGEWGALPPGVQEAQDMVNQWNVEAKTKQLRQDARIRKQQEDLARRTRGFAPDTKKTSSDEAENPSEDSQDGQSDNASQKTDDSSKAAASVKR